MPLNVAAIGASMTSSILLLGGGRRERAAVAAGLRSLGAEVVTTSDATVGEAERDLHPAAVVIMAVDGTPIGPVVRRARTAFPSVPIVVLCVPVSLATAFEAGKAGASAVLNLGTPPAQLLAALRKPGRAMADTGVPSLSRVQWEYLSAVVTDCGGNKSRAAKRLGLRRWSLQRKLGKAPPLR